MRYTCIKLWKLLLLPANRFFCLSVHTNESAKYEIFMRFTIAICRENWSAVRTALSHTFFCCVLYLQQSLRLLVGFWFSCYCCCYAEVAVQCHKWGGAFTSVLWHMCVTSGLKSNVIQFHLVDIKIEFDILFYYYFYAFVALLRRYVCLLVFTHTNRWHTKLFHIWSLRANSENCLPFFLSTTMMVLEEEVSRAP